MISIDGELAIRTITGRNGNFNVGRLITRIGEFAVKDALLEQYGEGKYQGTFVITQISPSSWTASGRTVIEVRARLDSMTLDGMDNLSPAEAENLVQQVIDPLDEEQPTPATLKPHTPIADDAPFGMSPAELKSTKPRSKPTTAESAAADEELFGSIWPLGAEVKLDPTVDRQRMRNQIERLRCLGYELDFKNQAWASKQA
ncbi:conserved hypothetical protein [Pseudomonas sp. 8Z]|uniref:DUF3275 family protein n=1 Tax=Pseudomonas sp. 8Z TaxID=2653166 RepID=UPI0012EFE77F|nr:DUF3275 family protein [Pseudomonas sp. 8Z]VXC23844.1 conserved hypothetical protein [Pseudomonas sp. 8Z]